MKALDKQSPVDANDGVSDAEPEDAAVLVKMLSFESRGLSLEEPAQSLRGELCGS